MGISLLYRSEETLETVGKVGKDTLAQLAVEKITRRLGLSQSDARYFQQILSAPLTSQEDIAYRSRAMSEFAAHPDLLERLAEQFDRLSRLKADFEELKKEKHRLRRAATGEAIPDAAKNHLRVSAMLLKRCLVLLKAIRETVESYDPSSEALTRLQNELRSVTAEGAFEELCALCSELELFSETSGTAIDLRLGEFGGVVSAQLMDRRQIPFQTPGEKKKKRWFAKTEEEAPVEAAPISLSYSALSPKLRAEAMTSLARQLDRMAQQLFAFFLPIDRELSFYRSGVKYLQYLREKGIPFCYAEIVEGNCLSFEELCDPLLLLYNDDPTSVVASSLPAHDASGIAVFGSNGSGKTVWLRSVGLCCLFAQSGLPIPAKSVQVSPYRQILSHFSTAEKEFEAGNEAGRFEQEVREMASIVDEIGEHSLVLLNETFQTTAYAQGARGLSPILRYLSERGCRWILTSHLTQLQEQFTTEETLICKTDSKYAVRAIHS